MSLEEIVRSGNYDELSSYIRTHRVIDPNELSNALVSAVARGDVPATTLLLTNGASPNIEPSDNMPPLHIAVEMDNRELIRLLHDYGANINFANENGYTALHLAVDLEADTAWQQGRVPTCELIELLLKLGADPYAKDIAGTTPLKIAEQYDFSRAIELLQHS